MKHRKWTILLMLVLIGLATTMLPLTAQAGPKGKLSIFHAGSLTVPFAVIEKEFESKYPDVDVQRQAGGSTKMARLISEAGKSADIMASADYKVIDNNLIPDFSTWNIRFATNQLVLCYTEQSKYADQISKDNWYQILQKKMLSGAIPIPILIHVVIEASWSCSLQKSSIMFLACIRNC